MEKLPKIETLLQKPHCRTCLTLTLQNLTDLSTVVQVKERSLTVHEMLENLSSSLVIPLEPEKYPCTICQMCLSLLKFSFEFKLQFEQSESLLRKLHGETCVEKIVIEEDEADRDEAKSAAVELIYGGNKFDLNDVVVIEEDNDEQCTYDSFLNNLGSEITAEFINKNEENYINELMSQDEDDEGDVGKALHKKRNFRKRRFKNIKEKMLIEALILKDGKTVPQVDLQPDLQSEEAILFESSSEDDEFLKDLVQYECESCQKLFDSKRKLQGHIRRNHRNFEKVCEECGFVSKSSSTARYHELMHRGKQFQCHLCSKVYLENSKLKTHMKTHSNEALYLCNICGKKFIYANSLKYHMSIHTEEKNYVCNYCGKKYFRMCSLQRHIYTHTNEKPFKCTYCDKRFFSRGEKSNHEFLHKGIKPHECEYCGKKFATLSNKRQHYLTGSHTGPHQCDICSRGFVDVKYLCLHMKKAHFFDKIDKN